MQWRQDREKNNKCRSSLRNSEGQWIFYYWCFVYEHLFQIILQETVTVYSHNLSVTVSNNITDNDKEKSMGWRSRGYVNSKSLNCLLFEYYCLVMKSGHLN